MARPKELIDKELCERAIEELKKIKDNVLCKRLQAIISSASYPVTLVSEVMGISRITLWRWIRKFRAFGISGLLDKPRGHKASKLGEKERVVISKWLNESKNSKGEPIHWTLPKLIVEIKSEFDIEIGKTPLWRTLRKMGFVQKVPRPVHAKADPIEQDEFKKKRRKM